MKTLGVKFEVAGVKEAQASLDSLQKNLNAAIAQNKRAIQSSKSLKISTSKDELKVEKDQQELLRVWRIPLGPNSPIKRFVRDLNERNRNSYVRSIADQRIRRVGRFNPFDMSLSSPAFKETSNVAPEPVSTASSIQQRGEDPYDYIDNYQRTVQSIREKQYSSAVDIYSRPRVNQITGGFFSGIGESLGDSSLKNLESTLRRLIKKPAIQPKLELSDRSINLVGKAVGQSFASSLVKSNLPKQPGLVSKIASVATIPIKDTYTGFYQGVGMKMGDQFSGGFSNVLKEDLDIDFERNGEIVGKMLTLAVEQGIDGLLSNFEDIEQKSQEFADSLKNFNIDESTKALEQLFKSFTSAIASGPAKLIHNYKLANVIKASPKKVQKRAGDIDIKPEDLEGKNLAVINVAGMSGDNGKGGYKQADTLRKLASDKTVVFTSENPNTDIGTKSVNGKPNARWVLESMSTLGKLNLKGFNQDAIELAAKVAKIKKLNQDIPVSLVGYSGGGYVVEEALKILEEIGIKNVRGTTFATPNLKGGVKSDNVKRYMGKKDIVQKINSAAEYIGAIDNDKELVVDGNASHNFYQNINNPEIRKSIFGEQLNKEAPKYLFQDGKTPIKGQLIELESLYAKYISHLSLNLDEIKEELSVAPNRLVAKNRRKKLRSRGGKEVQRKLDDKDFKEIKLKDGVETAVLLSGGFSGAKGRSGAKFAKGMSQLVEDDTTQYIGVRNPFTDVVDKEDIRNPDPKKMIPKILEMFGEVHKLGYNPDATEIAAQVMDLLAKNPKLKVKVGGYSGGGYVMEDVMELLKSQGTDMNRVEVMGIGTPDLPGGIKNRDFKKVLGEKDPVVTANLLKGINNEFKDIIGFDIFPDLMAKLQNIEGIDAHDLDQYVANSKEVQDFFYGHIPGSVELVENYGRIESLEKETKSISQKAFALNEDESLDSRTKSKQGQILKKQYIEALKQIHALAKRSMEIGGGKKFADRREITALELEDAGVIVDPIQVEVSEDDPWNEVSASEDAVVEDRIEILTQRYKAYLKNILKQADGNKEASKQQLNNFKKLDRTSQDSYLDTIRKTFNVKARLFREAVKTGQLEVAREQGEQLLQISALIKKLYADIDADGEIDGSVKSNLKGLSGYATSVQNEVIEGSKANGRSPVGLTQSFAAQLKNVEEDGDNIAEGFIYGILESLSEAKAAGEDLVDAVDSGIREQGEINSPSKLMERLGRFLAEGFRQGVAQISEVGDELEQRGRDVVADAAEGIREESDTLGNATENASSGIGQFFNSIFEQYPLLNKFKGVIGAIAGLFLGGLGISAIISTLGRLSGEALETAMAFESLDRAIVFVSRSELEGMDNLGFISDEAKRLSVDLTEAKQAYAGLIGAAKNTPIEGEQTKRLFSAFAESAANRGIDAQSQGRLFTALEQIIAKRQFSAEEVKGQIGDIRGFGDFQGILAQAQGVSTAELAKMMSQGEVGLDVVPKVVALIEAQNAAATVAQTAQQAQTQYNNSLTEFKNTLGQLLQPLQKLILNVLVIGLDFLSSKLDQIFKLISITAGVILLNMFSSINVVNLATIAWTKSIDLLTFALKRFWASKMLILAALGRLITGYGLVTAAYLAWSNVIALTKNQYQDIADGADSIADGMNRYREAIEAASTAQSNFNDEQGKLELNAGWELPDNWFGNILRPIVGGDYLNLDNLVRNRWNNDVKDKFKITTEAERRDADRRIATGEISFRTGQLLMKSQPATKAAEEINKFDAQIREIQAKRLELLPGDTKALETSLEKEREVSKQRDIQLKILTTYQQELQNAIAKNKAVLELPDLSSLEREQAEKDLEDTEETLNEINSILSKVTKALSEFQRQLRNSNERINNFLERRGLQAQDERTEIITEGVEGGLGDRVIQIELEAASRRELTDYISELESTIDEGRKRLESGALAEGYRLVSESAEANGLTLDSATIDRMLSEEGRSQAQKDALSELKALRENRTKLGQYQEQLAQNIQTNRNSLIDFNRTISDYFFRINQQIKEAQIEVLRVVEQISRANIRNKLQSALSPNANSFVNQLISSTQSLLDQAASYAERVLGQKSARIQFATTERSLQFELQDFARNVGGASDALLEFEKRLRGGNSVSSPVSSRGQAVVSSNQGNSFADKTKQIAQRLGIDPHALMTIMLFETIGTLNPKIQGPNVPGQGRGRGLIQFMPATARGLGTSDTELAGMTDIEQLDYVEKYFAQFKGNFGAGKLENLYAAVLAGNPLKIDTSDGYTTAREGAKRMISEYGDKATGLLNASRTKENVSGLTREGVEVAKNALSWQGKHFKKGVYAMCAGFVRQVLKNSGVDIGVTKNPYDAGKQPNNGELMARSFFGSDIGTVFKDKNLAKPGDIIGFFDTYQYGQEPGAITHVGVYQGDDMMVDRSTSSAPVRHRSIDTFGEGNYVFVRPHQYNSKVNNERPVLKEATAKTNQLIKTKKDRLELTDSLIQNQERDALDIAIANNLKSDRQKVDFNITDSQFALDKLLDAGKDLMSQYDFTSAASEAAKSIRAVNVAFSDRGLAISREIIKYTDEINTINDIISETPRQTRMLRNAGRNDEADILVEKAAQAQLLLKPYQDYLEFLAYEYKNNTKTASDALKYVVEMNKLKEYQEQLNKRSLLVNQQSTILQARGTLEAQRQVKLHTEDLRLALKINELRQQNAPGKYLDSLITGERRQSQINTENINYDSQLQELDFEKKLLDIQSSSDNKNAEFLSTRGFSFESNKIKRDNAIAQENLRFERELVELRKQYQDRPEKLEEFTRAARKLNSVNLLSVENQFKSLGQTIEDNFITATQGFFSQFVTEGISFVDRGQNEKQLLEERLRYAEELVSLENQHKDEPGKLAHLKNRARELNEEKLDKIRSEFNLFSRTVDMAKQAVMEFVKQLAVMAAQKAAAKFLTSILGSAIGGFSGGGVSAVGNDYGSGAGIGAFVADKGTTVGDSIKSRKISDRNTSVLKSKFPGIAKAWNAEGEGAQLGVFHTGEELLSRKTGEAGRYQMLKREYGINPLDKVLNYSEGGSIGDVSSNILSGFSNLRPRIDLGAIDSRGKRNRAMPSKTINISQTIVSPDADSFRLNEDQRNQDLVERLRRGI